MLGLRPLLGLRSAERIKKRPMLKHRPLIFKDFFQKKDQCLLHLLELLLGLLLIISAADRTFFIMFAKYSSLSQKGQVPVCRYGQYFYFLKFHPLFLFFFLNLEYNTGSAAGWKPTLDRTFSDIFLY